MCMEPVAIRNSLCTGIFPYTKISCLVNGAFRQYALPSRGRLVRKEMDEFAQIKLIQKAISETLSADFDNVKILDVSVDRDVDFDGDEILKVDIIFEGTPRDIDARAVSGAVRRVRPRLRDLGEMAFPLLSFISRGDAGALKLESA